MSKYSVRAKQNMRKQVNAQIRMMKSIISSKQNELKKAQRYSRYNLPGYKRMTNAMKAGIAKAKADLQKIEKYKSKLIKEGKI